MSTETESVRVRFESIVDELTPSERRIVSLILADFPFAGLVGIKELSDHAKVSPATVTRLTHKIGCPGYQDFQRLLIDELKEGSASPIDLKRSEQSLPMDGFYREYILRLEKNLGQFRETLPESSLDQLCALIAENNRAVYLGGGRISGTLMAYMAMHLQQIRPKVFQLEGSPETLTNHIMRIQRKDVVVISDFRRYQPSVERLAREISRRASCTIVLITDRWMSPVAKYSSHVIPIPVDTGTAWDSYAVVVALTEAVITRVSENQWNAVQTRLAEWDDTRVALDEQDRDAGTD